MATPIPFGVYIMYGFSGSGNFSKLTNVQSISFGKGRTWATDPYGPATCTIVFRGSGAPGISTNIMILDANNDTPSGNVVFMGTVKDSRVDYGIKTSMDYTTITLESYLARWGRRQFTSRALAQAATLTQISTLATAIGFNTFSAFGGTGQSIAVGQTYVGNGLDLINQIMQTEIGHVQDGGGTYSVTSPTEAYMSPMVSFLQRNYDTTVGGTFADDSTASGIRYSDIQFTSAAQNYYTEATINPQGLPSQTSGSGNYNITQDSLDYTTGQALSHAQYLVSQYNSTSTTPVSITASYALQDSVARQSAFKSMVSAAGSGSLINVIFRGTTYSCIIEGVQMSADPGNCELQITLSAFDNNNYLILNNATFGTLGTSSTYPGNKLGF